MKTIIGIITMMVAVASSAIAQDVAEKDVPSVVLNALRSKYSNAVKVDWELHNDVYKAEFDVGSREHDVWIDKNGNITKVKGDFPKKELPQAVVQKLQSEFAGYKIDDADKIEEGGSVYYEVDLDGSKDERKVLFTAEGDVRENNIE